MTIEELVENFEELPDWEERYRALIEMGRALPVMPDSLKTPENKVRGCMSQVWMSVKGASPGAEWTAKSTDPFDFFVDSDSTLVKGLAAVLHLAYAGKPRKELAGVDIKGLFERLGLDQHISPNRRNGFFSMVERIKALAAS